MELVYSGSQGAGFPQLSADKSLGGYPSNSPVRNGVNDNIFSDISILDIENLFTDTRAIFIRNTSGAAVTNVTLWYVYGNSNRICKVEFAAVLPDTALKIEKIGGTKESPVHGNFAEANVQYAFGTLEIQVAGTNGDSITILGQTFSVTSVEDGDIEKLVDLIITTFIGNVDYIATKAGINKVLFTCKAIGVITTAIELDTLGTAYAPDTLFAGGIDNRTILKASMAVDEVLGIWLRRSFLPVASAFVSCDVLFQAKVTELAIQEKLEKGITLTIDDQLFLQNSVKNENIQLYLSWS